MLCGYPMPPDGRVVTKEDRATWSVTAKASTTTLAGWEFLDTEGNTVQSLRDEFENAIENVGG